MKKWLLKKEIVKINSRWLTLNCESWIDENKNELEYWRVSKADSVIIVPIQNDKIYCPQTFYRPGVEKCTLDLPGGRLMEKFSPKQMVSKILNRELNIPKEKIDSTVALNKKKWLVNSSFSNQGLWAFVAQIDINYKIPINKIGKVVGANESGFSELLKYIDCLQCRAVLYEWYRQFIKNKS